MRDNRVVTVGGVVRVWYSEEGWGVVDSEDTPGGCWAHFSSVLVPGYRALQAGQTVNLDYEQGGQDGYAFQATRVWPAGHEPYTAPGWSSAFDVAYQSELTITFDAPDGPAAGPPD